MLSKEAKHELLLVITYKSNITLYNGASVALLLHSCTPFSSPALDRGVKIFSGAFQLVTHLFS